MAEDRQTDGEGERKDNEGRKRWRKEGANSGWLVSSLHKIDVIVYMPVCVCV